MRLSITIKDAIDILNTMNLRVKEVEVPYNTDSDKEEYTIVNQDDAMVGELFLTNDDDVEIFGPRLLRERFKEHKFP